MTVIADPTERKEIVIYTDGACDPNPGKGGWGFYIEGLKSEPIFVSGGEPDTTNNRMEMTAVIEALREVLEAVTQPAAHSVTVYSDSKYVIDGITKWIKGWRKRNWKTKTDTDVKNKDLWMVLNGLNSAFLIKWKWVKGHDGNEGNELADALAQHGRDKQGISRPDPQDIVENYLGRELGVTYQSKAMRAADKAQGVVDTMQSNYGAEAGAW